MSGRRANGEGEEPIWIASEKRWKARYSDAEGNRRSVSSRVSAADCRRKRDEAIDDARSGIKVIDRRDRMTVGQWMTEWIDTWVDDGEHEARTLHNYRANLRNHMAPIAAKPLDGLTAGDVKAMLNAMARAGKAGTTRQLVYDQLKGGLERARLEKKIRENPADYVPRPLRDTEPVTPWTDEQAMTFLDSVEGDRLEAAWNIVMLLGLRQGEVLGLRWDDVHPDRVVVAGQLDRFTHQWKKRKGKAGAYTLGLPEVLVDLLAARRVAQVAEQLKAGKRWAGNPQNLVFTTTHGTPITHNSIADQWRLRVRRAGLPAIKFHSGRHFIASHHKRQGADWMTIGKLLGHSDNGVTAREVYIHTGDEVQTEAATRINALRPRRKAG